MAEMFGPLAAAHRQGFEDAVRLYGIHRNGVQHIGAMEHPVADTLVHYDQAALAERTGVYVFGYTFPDADLDLLLASLEAAVVRHRAANDLDVDNPRAWVRAVIEAVIDRVGDGGFDQTLRIED